MRASEPRNQRGKIDGRARLRFAKVGRVPSTPSAQPVLPAPGPDAFYAGEAEQVEGIGVLRDYYAWTWGDALFVAIDPHWHSPVPKVTIFFLGHDHLFAREKVDGVVYQEVPNPADNTYTAFNADAYDPASISLPGASYDPAYGVIMPNAGYLDVTVSPDRVTVSYVRAVLPGDEAKAGAANGAVAYSYSVAAR